MSRPEFLYIVGMPSWSVRPLARLRLRHEMAEGASSALLSAWHAVRIGTPGRDRRLGSSVCEISFPSMPVLCAAEPRNLHRLKWCPSIGSFHLPYPLACAAGWKSVKLLYAEGLVLVVKLTTLWPLICFPLFVLPLPSDPYYLDRSKPDLALLSRHRVP